MAKANTALADYARAYTTERVQKYRMKDDPAEKVTSGEPDILSHLLEARDDETNSVYSENELLGEAILLMMAGM